MKGIISSQAIVALFVMLMGVSGASAADVWNAADDFDLVHNPALLSPWSYGGGTGSQFQLVTIKFSANGLAGWETESVRKPDVMKNVTGAPIVYSLIGENGIIPAGALNVHSDITTAETGTVRWTAPFSGQFDVDCNFAGVYEYTGSAYPNGTYADVLVLVDGVSVFAQTVQFHGTTGFHDRLSLTAGSVVDFAVGYGPDAYGGWDRVIVDATITEVPEPATLSLLALGGMLVMRRRLKTR